MCPLLRGRPQKHYVYRVNFPRCSGILLHVTSLPGGHGIGDLGDSAHEFVEFLAESRQKIWQVLPLNPTGYGDSPYQCFSAFAGNPLFIDLRVLREQGLLSGQDLTNAPDFPEEHVAYGRVIDFKQGLVRKAAHAFLVDGAPTDRRDFDTFCQDNGDWLDDYALFMACKRVYKDVAWEHWDQEIRQRDSPALKEWQNKLSSETEIHKFAQFEFFRQWGRLRTHCSRRGIRIMGDIPIYVAHDSADVWAHPELFRLDEQGKPHAVAGVPRTTSAQPVNFGETLCIGGMYLRRLVTGGGLIASGHRSNCSILCDWTTSAVSRPTGRSQPVLRPRLEASG